MSTSIDTMSANRISTRTIFYVSSLLILPVLYVFFYVLKVSTNGYAIEHWLPKWDRLLLIIAIILLERIYTYKYSVSQRAVLGRDIISNVVNLYVTGPATAMLVLPILVLGPEHILGRKLVFAAPGQLGPFWLQVVLILLSVSFFRYWMHRFQHSNAFLWDLHSYHHRVTDLQAINGLVSHPLDYALRNVVVFLILGVIGFDPFAILLAVSAMNVTAVFSHCSADVKGGFLNYFFVTPEVHRWHHTVDVPEGYGYSCNYGVEFSFWDLVFRTYYLPKKDGKFVMPERIGHPTGLPDERNYLRLLLAPFGLYRPLPWFRRIPERPQPAE